MLDLQIIDQLQEAKVYYNAISIKDKTVSWLAELVYTMTLALEILRYSEEKYATYYAERTYKYQDFEKIQAPSTDLYNLCSVINNQVAYSEFIIVNKSIVFPKVQYKRYLRDIMTHHLDHLQDRSFFYRLEGYLQINDSFLKIVRRAVQDWEMIERNERKYMKSLLINKFKSTQQYVDINYVFRDAKVD